jgi:hypothetical protein
MLSAHKLKVNWLYWLFFQLSYCVISVPVALFVFTTKGILNLEMYSPKQDKMADHINDRPVCSAVANCKTNDNIVTDAAARNVVV